jgi:hexosaminidase
MPRAHTPGESIVIIPRPTTLDQRPGHFDVGPDPAVAGDGHAAALLANHLGGHVDDDGPIRTRIDHRRTDDGPPGGYLLDVAPDAVTLSAPTETGLLHGVQTLRQLLTSDRLLPCLRITDAPRLPWRGVMLDVARHFMPLEFLHAFVDEIAAHKLNVLHLHLTDDQGWRIEIDGWPRLTSVGAWRAETVVGYGPNGDGRPHGGFYTQDQLRDLVRHAADLGVTIVPEIELPGHVRAAIAAYPHLGNAPHRPVGVWTRWGVSEDILGVGDDALDFSRDVLRQVMDVFPAPYIHIGGEECPTTQWTTSPIAQKRVADLGLSDAAQLHPWFLDQMRQVIAERGRQAVCWDETGVQAELPPGLVPTAWRDPEHGARAIARGCQVIMAPHLSTYLDYAQRPGADEPLAQKGRLLPLADVYAYDPLAGPLPVARDGRPGVLGTQAQIWTEYAPTPDHVRYLAYPRLCAFAEVAWSAAPGDLSDFESRLDDHRDRCPHG